MYNSVSMPIHKGVFMGNLSLIIGIIAAIELLIAIVLIIDFLRTKNKMALCVFLISVGLIIDAFFISIGVFFEGGLPEGLSRIRFICHGALIPLLFPICGYGLKAGEKAMKVLWVFTGAVIVLGIAHAFAIDLELIQIDNVLRHTMAGTTPLWAKIVSGALSFGTVLPLIICGIIIWIKQKTPYMFLSGLLMFFFAGLGSGIGRNDLIFFITMFGELFMILFAYLYIRKDNKATL